MGSCRFSSIICYNNPTITSIVCSNRAWRYIHAQPSGKLPSALMGGSQVVKATDFDSVIRRFESYSLSQQRIHVTVTPSCCRMGVGQRQTCEDGFTGSSISSVLVVQSVETRWHQHHLCAGSSPAGNANFPEVQGVGSQEA